MVEQETASNGEEMGKPRVLTSRKNKPPPSLGRPEFDRSALDEFKGLPHEAKRAALKQTWAEVAFVLASRAKRFGMTVSTKDFGRLQQLVTSAGIAVDKVIPKTETAHAGNIVLNLFGSVGADKMLAMVAPPTPAIDVECTEVKEAPCTQEKWLGSTTAHVTLPVTSASGNDSNPTTETETRS